jgi:hypothetical protein
MTKTDVKLCSYSPELGREQACPFLGLQTHDQS